MNAHAAGFLKDPDCAIPDAEGIARQMLENHRDPVHLGALLAQARGDAAAFGDFRNRYRKMATEHGYEGHMNFSPSIK